MIKIFAGFALFHKKGIFFPVSSKYKLVHRRLYADKHQKNIKYAGYRANEHNSLTHWFKQYLFGNRKHTYTKLYIVL